MVYIENGDGMLDFPMAIISESQTTATTWKKLLFLKKRRFKEKGFKVSDVNNLHKL